jgi:hypothetical protein
VIAGAKHLQWPESRVQAALNYAEAFPEEIERAISENAGTDFDALKRMLPSALKVGSRRVRKSRHAQASAR